MEVRIESPSVIHPTFRLPPRGVCELPKMVPREGFEPPTYCLEGTPSIATGTGQFSRSDLVK